MNRPQRIARLVRRWRRDAKTIRAMAQDVVEVGMLHESLCAIQALAKDEGYVGTLSGAKKNG